MPAPTDPAPAETDPNAEPATSTAVLDDGRPIDPTEEFPRPPAEDFWEKYSGRLEFPLSWTAAVLFHVLVALSFFFAVKYLFNGDDRGAVPMRLIDVGGDDEDGMGSAGSGGELDPIKEGDEDPLNQALKDILEDPAKLPPVKDVDPTLLEEDPTGQKQLTEQEKAEAALKQKLRDKQKGIGQRLGQGPEDGRGASGQKGKGPGGDGNDMTRKRSLSWSLRFKFSDSREYLKQLAATKAVILIPMPPDNKKHVIIADLDNPTVHRTATDDDLRRVADQLKFFEQRPEEARALLKYLAVDGNPSSFYICFPKAFEEELAQKEVGYRNRRKEDIHRTVFEFTVRGGSYNVVVTDQQMKK